MKQYRKEQQFHKNKKPTLTAGFSFIVTNNYMLGITCIERNLQPC